MSKQHQKILDAYLEPRFKAAAKIVAATGAPSPKDNMKKRFEMYVSGSALAIDHVGRCLVSVERLP